MIMSENKPWEQWYNERQFNIEYPNCTCYESLKNTVNKYPEYKAYNYFGVEKEYKKILEDVDVASNALAKLGVKKGDYVTICSSNVPEAVISFYAINKLGAISNMVHPKTSIEELEYFLTLTSSKLVIALDSVVQPFLTTIENTKVEKVITFGVFDSAPDIYKNTLPQVELESQKIDIVTPT